MAKHIHDFNYTRVVGGFRWLTCPCGAIRPMSTLEQGEE